MDWDVIWYARRGAELWCVTLWSLMMVLNFLGIFTIYRRRQLKPKPPPSLLQSSLPGVTILRPLKGMDVDLVVNLESSFVQEYDGPVEIIFSVASANDKAVQVVQDLKAKYPKADARLIVGAIPVGVNPKVCNLTTSYESAKHPIIWILDSNVHMPPETLLNSIYLLSQPNVGLVHHLPTGTDPQTLGSSLEYAFLNTSHAKMYSSINALDIDSCVVGKSTLFRKEDLDRHCGGLRAFGNTMSEDNAIGQALRKAGLKHVMGPELAQQSLGRMPVKAYFDRRGRWIRIRVHTVMLPTLLEMFSESVMSGITGSWAVESLFGVVRWKVLLAHFVVWAWSDFVIAGMVDPGVMGSWKGIWRLVRGWVGREMTAFPLWAVAVSGKRVTWRGKKFRFLRDGSVVADDRKQK